MRFSGLFIFITLASARSIHRPGYTVHESRTGSVSPGWIRTERVDDDRIIPLSIGLVQTDTHLLVDSLMAVSSPLSSNYSKHWSADQISKAFAPSQATIDAVKTWLRKAGFKDENIHLTKSKGWIQLNVTAKEAKELIDAEYQVFTHTTGQKHIACDSYSIPRRLQSHIDLIIPGVSIDYSVRPQFYHRSPDNSAVPFRGIGHKDLSKNKLAGTTPNNISDISACANQKTLGCLMTLYGIKTRRTFNSENSYGIVEYTPESYLPTDLDMFFEKYAPQMTGRRPTMASIDGGRLVFTNQSFEQNGESGLDLDASFNNFLDAIDGTYCLYEGGDDPSQNDTVYPDPQKGGYKQTEYCGVYRPTFVISTSYGYNEADLTPFYERRQCNEYVKLGLQGVSILYSSGDNGVAGSENYCLYPNGTQEINGTRFNPGFPGTCPFVTAVGATQIKSNTSVLSPNPEEACETVIYSGGGFSNVFERPLYQAPAVGRYFVDYEPLYFNGTYNTTYVRGFPDVSANGANYVVVVDGEFTLVYGTSASSPVFGSMITLINDARLTAGKSPLGFLNPVLYSLQYTEAFRDITSGTNQGCNTTGFTAVPGWDPVTGLGTPNFLELRSYLMLLP